MNNNLILLRKLADQNQFVELREMCQNFWDESHDPELLPSLALAHHQLGEIALAKQFLKQAQGHQSDYNVQLLGDLAAVLILFGRVSEAVDMLEEVLAQQPDHALSIARLGYCRMLEKDYELARDLFKKAIEITPDRLTVFANLAQVYLFLSEFEACQQVLDQAFAALTKKGSDLPQVSNSTYIQQLYDFQCKIWVERQQYDFAEMWLQEQLELQQQDDLTEEEFVHFLSLYARHLAEHGLHQQSVDILREYSKIFSHNISLYLQMAELCQVQGHFMQSLNLLQKALKLDQSNIALWVKLALTSLHRFDKKARQAAEKAVELAEALQLSDELSVEQIKMQQATAQNALANVESHDQNFDIAEKIYRKILAEHENFIPALQGLAQQQMQCGQIDEAIELFERVKKIDPLRGHLALINARRFPDDVSVLDKIEQAANVPSIEGPLRSSLLFQLAAAWEKRGEYDKAFEFASQANQATKKFLPYDSKDNRNKSARIRYGFCSSLYERRPEHGIDSTVPVYVLGMPRSGTTLVEQIIAGHSKIFGAGELGLIPQVAEGLNRWERHVGSGRSYPDCVDDLTPKVSAGLANNVLKDLQELAPEAAHVVDKLPHNFQHIGLIKFLFPKAKIISVRRDPRDIAISNFFTDYQAKHGGMGFAYDLTDIGEQLADHNQLMHHWHQQFPGEILEVNYEDVVDDLEANARKMLDFIGVDWEPEVLSFNKLERAVKTASVWQVRQPIYKTSKARWTRYQNHLAPLIKGTNNKIQPDPIEMLSLPEPGFLVEGVDLFREGDLDGAELSFKKMLHHNPGHAACLYMLGMVYLRKGHLLPGIEHIEKALEVTPWQREWCENLQKAYVEAGEHEKAAALESRVSPQRGSGQAKPEDADNWLENDAVEVDESAAGSL